jgi:pimeloyl-ACP methyl ester carboxylesterase
MKNIYLISGLATDEKVFRNLDFGNNCIHHIPWVKPEFRDESIENYAFRLIQTKIHHENPIIIGLSFGGMMAIEIAKQIKTEKVVLISTAKSRDEFSWIIKFLGKIKLHKIFPISLLKINNFISNYLFGMRSKSEKDFLTQILKNADSDIIRWSIEKIVNWRNSWIPGNAIHIHGTDDHIFPIRNINCDITIDNAGHMMVFTKAVEVGKVLQKIIDE